MTSLCRAGRVASLFLRSKRHLSQLALQPELPKLLVLGQHDQFSSVRSLRQVVNGWGPQHMPGHPNHDTSEHLVEVTLLPGCDHFYVHQRSDLAGRVLHFCLHHHMQHSQATKLSE